MKIKKLNEDNTNNIEEISSSRSNKENNDKTAIARNENLKKDLLFTLLNNKENLTFMVYSIITNQIQREF